MNYGAEPKEVKDPKENMRATYRQHRARIEVSGDQYMADRVCRIFADEGYSVVSRQLNSGVNEIPRIEIAVYSIH